MLKQHRLNWENIKYFIQTVEAGSALAAAKEMRVNHSTVTRRIQQFETDLGVQLFNRVQQGYQLTAAGQQVHQSCQAVEESVAQLIKGAAHSQEAMQGEIRVSYPGNALVDFSPLFSAFCQQHPGIGLQIHCSTETADLEKSQAQLALRLTEAPPPSLVGSELGRVSFGAYAHEDYLAQHLAQRKSTLNAANCDWLLWTGSAHTSIPAVNRPDALLVQRLPEANIVLRSDAMEDIVSGVRSGLGVGLISDAHGSRDSSLVRLAFDDLLEEIGAGSVGLWLLAGQDLKQNNLLKVLYNYIKAQYSSQSGVSAIENNAKRND